MKKSVLYLHETGRISGAENSLLNLMAGLDKEIFRPVVACPADGGFADALSSIGVKVCPIHFPPVRRFFGLGPTVRLLRTFIREENISLVHSNSIRTHIYGWLAARASGIPIIWHERNLIDKEKELIDPDRLLSFLPDAIICNSGAVAARFMKRGKVPAKVHVIINGVDIERFNPAVSGDAVRRKFGITQDEITIGIASRFHKIKGHETLFSAVARIFKHAPEARKRLRLLVVGGGVFNEDTWREEYLKKLIKEIKIEDRVILTGPLNNMPEAYAAMDIVVLPSLSEACGRVVIEAMATGKPIIGTDVGGTPEMIDAGRTGILFTPGDSCGLADAILSLVNDPHKRLAMGAAGRARAEKVFDIKEHIKKTEKLYQSLINSRA